MDYTMFLETLRLELTQKLGEGQTLMIRPVPRNNGVTLDGLSIRTPDSFLTPTVYLNPYYQQFKEGMSIEDICKDIVGLFGENLLSNQFSEEKLADFESMQPRIMMRLIHKDSNLGLLQDVPHIPYLDLSIVFHLFLEHNSCGQMTVLIHNDLLEQWQVNAQALLRLALKNTPVSYPPRIKSMIDVMKDIARRNLGDDYDEEHLDQLLKENEGGSPLYVLSNQTGIYGACCILYQNTLKNFADSLGSDLIIIPSSIHEVLLTPCSGELSYDYLNSMVTGINHSEVPAEDQLSDHVYLYTRADDRIHVIHT